MMVPRTILGPPSTKDSKSLKQMEQLMCCFCRCWMLLDAAATATAGAATAAVADIAAAAAVAAADTGCCWLPLPALPALPPLLPLAVSFHRHAGNCPASPDARSIRAIRPGPRWRSYLDCHRKCASFELTARRKMPVQLYIEACICLHRILYIFIYNKLYTSIYNPPTYGQGVKSTFFIQLTSPLTPLQGPGGPEKSGQGSRRAGKKWPEFCCFMSAAGFRTLFGRQNH